MKTLMTAKMNGKNGEFTLTATEGEFKTIKSAVKFMNEMRVWASKKDYSQVKETRKYAQSCIKAETLNMKLRKIKAWTVYCEGFRLSSELAVGNFFC